MYNVLYFKYYKLEDMKKEKIYRKRFNGNAELSIRKKKIKHKCM